MNKKKQIILTLVATLFSLPLIAIVQDEAVCGADPRDYLIFESEDKIQAETERWNECIEKKHQDEATDWESQKDLPEEERRYG